MNKFLTENITWVLGVCAVVGLAYFEARLYYRVDTAVKAEVNAVGGVTPDQLALVKAGVDRNASDITKLEGKHDSDGARWQGKIDRIVDILLEE